MIENQSTWPNRCILVTGASGFIGHHLCKALSQAGAVVHGLSRNARRDTDATSYHICDLGSLDSVRRVFETVGPDIVYHLASHVSGSRDLDAVAPTLRGNLVSTVNILTAATESDNPRVILAGSLEEPDFDEPVPVSPYAAAKAASTVYASMFRSLYDLPVTVARIFMVYGPEQPNRYMLIPHVIFSLLRGESPALSSGKRPVDWVFVADVVAGLQALATVSAVPTAPVDIGSGLLVTVGDVIERITARIDSPGHPVLGAIPDRSNERVRKADVAATRELIGWQPAVSLDEGLDRTIAWARQSIEDDC